MSSSLSTVASGIQYGLVKRGQSLSKINKVTNRRPLLSVFKDELEEDDTEETSTNDISRVNQQLRLNAEKRIDEVNRIAKCTQQEDPNVFDFDGTYDSYKRVENSHPLSSSTSKDAPKSRYVENLKSTAALRERERDRIYEKKLLKEREVEDAEFGDQPKFMTSAYKKKLIEDKKWEYENMLADKLDERTDVRSGGMEGFYKNLLTKNISMGSSVQGNAVSIYTAGSAKHSTITEEPKPIPAASIEEDIEEVDDVNKSASAESPLRNPSPTVIEASKSISTSNSIEITSSAPTKAMVSKEEQVALARQRYLDRKRKLEAT